MFAILWYLLSCWKENKTKWLNLILKFLHLWHIAALSNHKFSNCITLFNEVYFNCWETHFSRYCLYLQGLIATEGRKKDRRIMNSFPQCSIFPRSTLALLLTARCNRWVKFQDIIILLMMLKLCNNSDTQQQLFSCLMLRSSQNVLVTCLIRVSHVWDQVVKECSPS